MTWHPHHRVFYVYLLLEYDRVRYVGLTTNPRVRWRVHWITARQNYRARTPLRDWLLGAHRDDVSMLVLERLSCSAAEARRREAATIDAYRRLGAPLLNVAGTAKQPTLW